MSGLARLTAALALVLALVVPATAAAAPPVTTTKDNAIGSPLVTGSLRAAIAGANSGDTIPVPAGTYDLTGGELLIDKSLTISGAGAGTTTIRQTGAGQRVIHVSVTAGVGGAAVTIAGVTVTGGNVTTDAPATGNIGGGGILNQTDAKLTVQNAVVSGNSATAQDNDQVDGGGGIYNDTVAGLIVIGSTVTGNAATMFQGSDDGGGGIYTSSSSGPLTISSSTVSANTFAFTDSAVADSGGAGVFSGGGGTMTITGSTIANNAVTAPAATSTQLGGGGILSFGGAATITDSAVRGNSVTLSSGSDTSKHGGGGIYQAQNAMSITRSTISGNKVTLTGTDPGADYGGGGIFQDATSPLTLTNSTISGNTSTVSGSALSTGGGGIHSNGTNQGTFTNVTFAGNTSNTSGGAIFTGTTFGASTERLRNSVFGGDTAPAGAGCGGPSAPTSLGNNVESANTCNLVAAGDKPNTNPLLGGLAANGGATQTHALLPGSPAIDAANGVFCPGSDQRGVPRFGTCDSGAYEFDGLSAAAAACDSLGKLAITLTPPPGRQGAAARFRVDGGAAQRMAASGSPSRAQISVPDGTHTVESWGEFTGGSQETVHHSKTLTCASVLPPPVLGRTYNLEPLSGKVFVSLPAKKGSVSRAGAHAAASVPGLKGRKFIPLSEARQVPFGSFVDTRKGKVRITSARDRTSKRLQSGRFLAGVFQVLQSRKRSAKGLTELRLKGASFKNCTAGKKKRVRRSGAAGASAQAARLSRRTVRRLRGNAKGRFRTRGRHSAATVRGTIWAVADRCDGTLTKVTRGKVAVRDFRRRKTVLVRAGKSYLARARR